MLRVLRSLMLMSCSMSRMSSSPWGGAAVPAELSLSQYCRVLLSAAEFDVNRHNFLLILPNGSLNCTALSNMFLGFAR